MNVEFTDKFYFAATRGRQLANRLACATGVVLAAITPLDAGPATVLTVTAVSSTPSVAAGEEGILSGLAPRASAANDFHEFVCAFNSSGGMLTAIVNAALAEELDATEFSVSIDGGADTNDGASDLSFPWYKPNCDGGSFLTAHTRALCDDFLWSEPIYEMLVGYFSAADYDRPLRRHEDVFGATLCLAGREFPEMLHEVGLSDLNTRLVFENSPAACLQAVVEKRADLTLLPINMAALEVKHFGLEGQIEAHPALDRVMTLHTVAHLASLTASADIELFNRGVAKLRDTGAWFEIVQKFANGHDHDHAYPPAGQTPLGENSE